MDPEWKLHSLESRQLDNSIVDVVLIIIIKVKSTYQCRYVCVK
jgi:hypothetical protein